MSKKEIAVCDECGSEYWRSQSKMMSLCPNCAHMLYGYENCVHVFENGRCIKCYWNGHKSNFLKSLE